MNQVLLLTRKQVRKQLKRTRLLKFTTHKFTVLTVGVCVALTVAGLAMSNKSTADCINCDVISKGLELNLPQGLVVEAARRVDAEPSSLAPQLPVVESSLPNQDQENLRLLLQRDVGALISGKVLKPINIAEGFTCELTYKNKKVSIDGCMRDSLSKRFVKLELSKISAMFSNSGITAEKYSIKVSGGGPLHKST